MDRDVAWKLLCEYTEGDSLRKHALSVEATMRYYARKSQQDEEKWGVVGLLHDFDYEKFPEEHPVKGSKILEQHGYSKEIRRAILSHVGKDVKPESKMEKTLYAVDELCGFITAVTLVRPSKKIADVKVKSVKKKLKDKAFARAVNREHIYQAMEILEVDIDEHITNIITAMQEVAESLGL